LAVKLVGGCSLNSSTRLLPWSLINTSPSELDATPISFERLLALTPPLLAIFALKFDPALPWPNTTSAVALLGGSPE